MKLYGELFKAAIVTLNKTCNSKTGNYTTPYAMVKGIKPVIDEYSFG